MRLKKKFLSLLLSVSMIAGLTGAFSVTAGADENISYPDTVMGTMTLYDYEMSDRNGAQYLLFGKQESKNSGQYNSWSKENDWRITQGIAEDTLNSDGEFELAEQNVSLWAWQRPNYKKLTVPGTESGKLFRSDELVGVYQMPFNHIGDGRYEYDSADFKLTANDDTKILEVSEYAAGATPAFLPLGDENYYFGAKLELPFIYKNDGTVNNGDDMVFEFTGDDDIWVYVDGRLALDLGGIHNAVSGTINFNTLEVTTVGKINNGDADDKETVTSIADWFDTDETEHDLTVFYLERGAGSSNFKASFNLIQPASYTVKYYDGKYYNGKTGTEGLIATVAVSSREDGTRLYSGDEVKQSEIKINVNDKTAELIASDEYYGGFVVDDNFIKVTDPDQVVTTVTDDDTDTVYVIFIPKPAYTVTYWMCNEGDEDDMSKWTQVTQKVFQGTDGQEIRVEDIDTSVEFMDKYYEGKVVTPDTDGLIGVLSSMESFNVDVLVVETEKPTPTPEVTPTPEPAVTPEPEETPEPTPLPEPYELTNDYAYIFGRTDTLMEPNDGMRRGESAAVLYRLLKQNGITEQLGFVYYEGNPPVFSNMAGQWDRSALEYMAHIGVYGTETGTIDNYSYITRGEAFKMMAIALGFTNDTTLTEEQYAQILFDTGYIIGDQYGNLNLGDIITRAEYCTIYNRIIGRDNYGLEMIDASGEIVPVTSATYGFTDIDGDWYTEILLKATSAYNEDGYVDLSLRAIRNDVDDYA